MLPNDIGRLPIPTLAALSSETPVPSTFEQLQWINERRARKGLPPLESRRRKTQ